MKRMGEDEGQPIAGQPRLSKYAKKQRDRLLPPGEIVMKLSTFPEPSFTNRCCGLQAIVPDFNSQSDFMFLSSAADGEPFFLSKAKIKRSSFELRTGDIVHCDVATDPGKKHRRVVFIHRVERPKGP